MEYLENLSGWPWIAITSSQVDPTVKYEISEDGSDEFKRAFNFGEPLLHRVTLLFSKWTVEDPYCMEYLENLSGWPWIARTSSQVDPTVK